MTNPTTDRIIEGAAARLAIGWTQEHMAEDVHGLACDPEDTEAAAWCALGAVTAAVDSLALNDARQERKAIRAALYRVAFAAGCADDDWEEGIESAVSSWNDDDRRTQEDVVLAFKRALHD